MKTLAEELQEQIPNVSLGDCKKIISTYNKFSSDIRREHCNICMKPLDEEELRMRSSLHFNYCCKEHQAYVGAYQIWHIQRELGIPEPNLFELTKQD